MEIEFEDWEKEESTRRMSSSQAEFLNPLILRKDRGTLSSLEKIRGAQERPKTRARKQYLTPSKSKHKYLYMEGCIAMVRKASCKSSEAKKSSWPMIAEIEIRPSILKWTFLW